MLTCGSPWLIAAYRVLHRQSVPWHPPCALVRLILPVHVNYYFLRLLRVVINLDCCCLFLPCAVFKVRLRSPQPFGCRDYAGRCPSESTTVSRACALPPECLKYQLIVDPSKRYRNQSFCLSDSVDLLANYLFDTLCRCCCSLSSLPVFPASCN